MRKQYLIIPKFQWTFLSFTAGLIALVLSITYGAYFYFIWKFQKLAIQLDVPEGHLIHEMLRYQKTTLFSVLGIVSVLVTLILLTLGILFSHRIAGPLYKLRQHMLKDIENRKITPVSFRKHDFFQDIAEVYSRLSDISKKH